MTTHALIIGARGQGLLNDIQEGALAKDSRLIARFASDALELTGKSSSFDFIENGSLEFNIDAVRRPTVVVIEDIDGITNEIVDELVETLVAWSGNHPELPVSFYWDLIGLAPERTLELTEKLLPLVMLG